MRAVARSGETVRVVDVPDPVPGSQELLVKVEASALNGADRLRAAPAGQHEPEQLRGYEMAGTVVGHGTGASRFALGDRVMGLVDAGQAELAVIHERVAIAVPHSLSIAEAGGFCEVFWTAYDAVFTQCRLDVGDRLLVTGAAGGVGMAAVQLGHACGATVIASVRDTSKWNAVESLGARVTSPDDAYANGPFDVILELVGGAHVQHDIDALAVGGRISLIGLSAGAKSEIDFRGLVGSICSSRMRSRALEDKALVARRIERRVLPLVESGAVRVLIDSTFPLADAPAAYTRFMEGGKLGKIVLTME
jgi:NADPH:quinone reductase-like Zn-dependent oxidoreductase